MFQRFRRIGCVGLASAWTAFGAGAAAGAPQLGGPGLALPDMGGVAAVVGDVRDDLAGAQQRIDDTADDLDQTRLARLREVVRADPRALELDANGAPVVRAEVLAIDPLPASIEIAAGAGFKVLRSARLDPFDIVIVTLSTPDHLRARDALRRLRALDPAGRYDLDHLYSSSGGGSPGADSVIGVRPLKGSESSNVIVGMLDTGVEADHPLLGNAQIEQAGFAPGGVTVAGHGTAVASLLLASAPGARLYVADVYGAGPTGGSVDDIVRALAWMAERKAPVVNISLVGPPNLILEIAVRDFIARGALVVAPVGNDGPAAPALYPASYPGVIAVTAIDAAGRLLPEAGRAGHIDFAAPGENLPAAKLGGGLVKVRGTSFAAPIVSGRLANLVARSESASRALAELDRSAKRGDAALGRGIVGDDLAVKLRGSAR